MKIFVAAALLSSLTLTSAEAAGWASVHRYVKPSGNCAGSEVLASSYSSRGRTASGAVFNSGALAAAARTWALGTRLTVMNPRTGRSANIVINDTGPYGIAYRMGARLDLTTGAARHIGMRGTQYICVL